MIEIVAKAAAAIAALGVLWQIGSKILAFRAAAQARLSVSREWSHHWVLVVRFHLADQSPHTNYVIRAKILGRTQARFVPLSWRTPLDRDTPTFEPVPGETGLRGAWADFQDHAPYSGDAVMLLTGLRPEKTVRLRLRVYDRARNTVPIVCRNMAIMTPRNR